MILLARGDRSRFTGPAAVAAALAAAGTLLLGRFPPDRYNFYPRCPVWTYLHVACPGCGTTRAIAALLHGHVAEAFQFNALTTMLLPIAFLYLVRHLWRQRQETRFSLPHPPPYVVLSLLTIAACFTLVRNLKL